MKRILMRNVSPSDGSLLLLKEIRFSKTTGPWKREVLRIKIYGLEKVSLLVTSHQAINENYSHK